MGTLDEVQLTHAWAQWHGGGDSGARDELVKHYLPLVNFLAGPFYRHVPESYRGDLISFGVLGLIDALDKFDPSMGYRFETYGSCRVRGAMSDGIRALAWLPRGAAQRASRIIEKVVPVDFQAARTADGTRLQDCLADRNETTPLDALELMDDHEDVATVLQLLPERERAVITQYYFGRRQLKEIGADLGVTESRVCQLHRRALRQLEQLLLERRSA